MKNVMVKPELILIMSDCSGIVVDDDPDSVDTLDKFILFYKIRDYEFLIGIDHL